METEREVKNYISNYGLVKLYVYFMFLIYPIFFHNYYFDIVTCKYILFLIVTGIMFIISVFYIPENIFKKIKMREIRFSVSDYFMFAFLIVNVISTLLSGDILYGLNGASGRNMGLSTVICLTFVYFLISRTFKLDETFYRIAAIGSVLVSIVGILQFAGIDFLGFYDKLESSQKLFYISTLGHVDVYTSYFALTIPVLFIKYLHSTAPKEKFFYLTALITNGAGVVCGQCDSAYIVIFASIFLTLIFGKCRDKRVRISEVILPFVLIEVIVKALLKVNDNAKEVRIVSTFTKALFNDKAILILAVILGISILIEMKYVTDVMRFKNVYLLIMGVGIVAYIILIICFTTIFKEADLGKFETILRFSDSYGSYRGYIWKVLVKDYRDMPFINKLFGIGTDLLRPYLVAKYGDKMYRVTNAYYDNAHNECLQYLATTGIIGLITYAGLVIASIKNALKNENLRIILAAVLCYLAQSFVNINQVVTTPLFFIMLSLLNCREVLAEK